jgi:chloride channel protein, CIC family
MSVEIRTPAEQGSGRSRLLTIIGLAVLLGLAAGVIAQLVTGMIGFFTNLSFYGRISIEFISPMHHRLGAWVMVLPAIGGIIIGLLARYGSKAIRGHGIPETMEQVLLNESRIPPRIIVLKPLSAAISIGTGGPFGAEGPIIATGGALGSLVGQLLHTTADERKTLLAAGAAAGMSAIFASPVSAVLLAIELLLFEFRSRSFLPVAIASVAATAVHASFEGLTPVFHMPTLAMPTEGGIGGYLVIGAIVGVLSVFVTRITYWIEDRFEKLPIHWMWWPAIGGLFVGVIGYFFPRTLGVGYENISGFLNGEFTWQVLLILAVGKFFSWSIALGSGTSGGTLAPLFTVGGALAGALAMGMNAVFPGLAVDPRMAALIGMAAMFSGAARALLASVVFAFETTLQSSGLLPLLAGCSGAYLLSSLLMKHTIMTEKIARRGLNVPSEYAADFFARSLVRNVTTHTVVTVSSESPIDELRAFFDTHDPKYRHQGYPVVDSHGELVGVVTRKDIRYLESSGNLIGDLLPGRIIVVFEDNTLREAADLMVQEHVGRLPVVRREDPRKLIGIITRSDLLQAHSQRLHEQHTQSTTLDLSLP